METLSQIEGKVASWTPILMVLGMQEAQVSSILRPLSNSISYHSYFWGWGMTKSQFEGPHGIWRTENGQVLVFPLGSKTIFPFLLVWISHSYINSRHIVSMGSACIFHFSWFLSPASVPLAPFHTFRTTDTLASPCLLAFLWQDKHRERA